jgi:DNA-binding response OmpR family regulator
MVERAQTNRPLFGDALKKRYSVATASSGKRALELAAELSPRVVVLDAISLRTPGDRICQLLHDQLPKIPLIHLHPGPKETVQSCADIVLVEKFTSRKLINAIERLLHGKMAPAPDDTLACGPFTLHLKRRLLVFRGQETSLSPKLAQLVELFLRHPGETLDRKRLMEHVWNTDYLGDTRTLDVHIRYIRCAVESNPGKPVYFRTVRGVGYRLEILDHPQKHAVPESALEVIS